MSRPDRLLLAAAALALVARAAVDCGAPPAFGTVTLVFAILVALSVAARGGRRWCDGPRALLCALVLLDVPSVYGRLGGDGYEYYALLRSPLLDLDLDFANDYAGLGAKPVVTPGVGVTSRVLVGQAIAWSPAFALAHGAALLPGGPAADGFSQPYQSAVTLASFAWAALGLLLCEALLRPRFGRAVAALAALGLWYATPLRFYATANAFMSHATSAGLACLLVFLWLRARDRDAAAPARYWLWVGAAGALLSLVRAQDAVLLSLPALDLVLRRPPALVARFAWLLAAPVAGAALQLAVWLAMYGTAFLAVTAEQNWVATAGSQWLLVLLSPRHGLFTWHPLFAVAALGWLGWLRRDRALAALFVTGLALSAFVNGLLIDWWGSDAFGQRRLLCLLPLFGLGLGAALDFLRRRPLLAPALALVALGLWNDQLSYIHNSNLVGNKDQGATLDRVAAAQVDVAWRTIDGWRGWLPRPLWVLAYDHLRGVWLDDGPWSLRGELDLGGREAPAVAAAVGEGWYPAAAGADFRASRGRRSRLALPVRHALPATLVLRARAEPPELAVRVRVRLGGVELGEAPLGAEWSELRFEVPAAALAPGFNAVELLWSATARADLDGWSGRNTAGAVDRVRLLRE